MTFRFLSLALPLALTLAACADADAPLDMPGEGVDYAQPGPWSVGYTVLPDDALGESLEVKAWYPAQATAAEAITYEVVLKLPGFPADPMPFLGAAIADAPPDQAGGPYPLVVLSHGFSLNPEWYHPLAEHLASHGFVVLAPEHTESDWAGDVVAASVQRPAEVSDTIDLARSGVLQGVIDSEHVAIMGHSYGGYTALATGGARIQTDWLEDQCALEQEPFIADMFCGVFLDGQAQLADEMGLDAVPEGMWPSLADDRIDAVIAIAPDAYLFGEAGLAELTVPALIVGGTGDTGSPWGWGAGLAWDHISSDSRMLVAFEGAEHFINVTTCDAMPWAVDLPAEFTAMICEDPAWDKDAALDISNEMVAMFLAHTFADAPQTGEALQADLDDVPGLRVNVISP